VIPYAEQWAKQSSAIFGTDKTSLIHFSRSKTYDDTRSLYFGNDEIKPQESEKMLGVILDKKLTMHPHVTKVANKAAYTCIALRSIRGVRPAQTRQLYESCVLPTVDYAVSTWYGPGKEGTTKLIKTLEKTQRLGTRELRERGRQSHHQSSKQRHTSKTRKQGSTKM
jgi:hypothetical protein